MFVNCRDRGRDRVAERLAGAERPVRRQLLHGRLGQRRVLGPGRDRRIRPSDRDFDGDGRDDIAYLGRCGSTTACMRAHISTTGNVFAAKQWGSEPYLDGSITPHFGMRVVDHNGDGKDDIAYRGTCGDPGVPAWRFYMGSAQAPATVACSQTL
ncbi:FG-GAP-like repeat-containing protein [Nonomuraea sp. H19]|uniref:FG-GAP-like repeat-containing protein n=1 Tax=Nonomuraea sp. H19 TaxID=3452206 RepID=UPI003F89360A